MGNDIREENIARNNAFKDNLGLGNNSAIMMSSHLCRNAASNSGQNADCIVMLLKLLQGSQALNTSQENSRGRKSYRI